MSSADDFLKLFEDRGLVDLAQDVGLIKDGLLPSFKDLDQPDDLYGSAAPPPSPLPQLRKRRRDALDALPAEEDTGVEGGSGTAANKKKRGTKAAGGSSVIGGVAGTPTATSDKQNKGLRHFSMKVCKKVEEKGQTTYNEVADELVHEFLSMGNGAAAATAPDKKPAFDEKNIRRRVYDALNVLMAMDIISKEKKDIRWKGLPSNAQHDLETLERDKARLERNIEKKREQLEQLIEQKVTYLNLVKRNAQLEAQQGQGQPQQPPPKDAIADGDEKIALPFIVINTNHETYIHCEMADDRTEVKFRFSAPFEISDDSEILRRLGLYQATNEELEAMLPAKLLPYVPDSVRADGADEGGGFATECGLDC